MTNSTTTSHTLRLGLIGCLGALLVLLVGSALTYLFLRQPDVALGPIVSFSYPPTNSASELNRPIQVVAFAYDTDGVMRIELYANGALAAVQSSTFPQGSNPLLFSQNWTPLTTGPFILFLRAYNRNGTFADSPVVRLEVVDLLTPTYRVALDAIPRGPNVPLPSLNQVSELSGVSIERLREANPQFNSVDPNTPLPSGTILDVPRSPASPPESGALSWLGRGSPGDRTSRIPPADPPPPPLLDAPRPPTGLTGTGDCNSVQLSWVSSLDEEYYVVYRLDPGTTRLNPIATLPASTVTYRDELPGLGTFHYFVAAVRRTLEGVSAIFSYTTPAVCVPPPPPGTRNLLLNFFSIEPGNPYESVYCYLSINGNPPERVPAMPDEMAPSPDDPQLFQFSQLPDHGLVSLPSYPESALVTVSANCQGRRVDGMSDDLGAVSASHPQADWTGAERVATARSFRLRYRIGSDTPEARQAAPFRRLEWPGLEPFPLPREKRPQAVQFIPTIPEPTNLRYDPNGREACDQISHVGERLACIATGKPTITWEWHGDESSLGAFWVDIDLVPTAMRVEPAHRAVLVPSNDLWHLNRTVCGRRQSFHVKASPVDPVNTDARVGEGFIEMPPCPSAALVRVVFSSLDVAGSAAEDHHIKDNDTCFGSCPDRTIEIYGSWQITTGDSETASDGHAWPCCTNVRDNMSTGYPFWRYAWGQNVEISESLHSTGGSLQVMVPNGSSLWVRINLLDAYYGFNFNTDPYCVANIEIPARTALEWQSYSERYSHSDDFGEAFCRITFSVNGVPP